MTTIFDIGSFSINIRDIWRLDPIKLHLKKSTVDFPNMSTSGSCDRHEHACNCARVAAQSLEEMEFERGIWSGAQYGEVEKVRRLVESGKYGVDQRDSAGYTSLHYAARNGHADVCKYLIQNGARIDAVTKSGQATALHRACSAGKVEIVKILLHNGANGELQDADGKTALHRAAEARHAGLCILLTSHFPHLKDIVDNKGNKPKI